MTSIPSVSTASHPAGGQYQSYIDEACIAIVNLKQRSGSSKQAILKFILGKHNELCGMEEKHVNTVVTQRLKHGVESDHYKQIKSSYRLVNIKSKSAGGAKKKTVGAKKKSAKITKTKKVTHTKKKSPKKLATHPDTDVVVHATAAA